MVYLTHISKLMVLVWDDVRRFIFDLANDVVEILTEVFKWYGQILNFQSFDLAVVSVDTCRFCGETLVTDEDLTCQRCGGPSAVWNVGIVRGQSS